jgi:hypothetical protein
MQIACDTLKSKFTFTQKEINMQQGTVTLVAQRKRRNTNYLFMQLYFALLFILTTRKVQMTSRLVIYNFKKEVQF